MQPAQGRIEDTHGRRVGLLSLHEPERPLPPVLEYWHFCSLGPQTGTHTIGSLIHDPEGLDENSTTVSPGPTACEGQALGRFSLYGHVSQSFIIISPCLKCIYHLSISIYQSIIYHHRLSSPFLPLSTYLFLLVLFLCRTLTNTPPHKMIYLVRNYFD